MPRIQPTVRFVLGLPISDDSELDDRPEEWAPADPSSFAIELQFFVGQEGEDALDVFEAIVCSPRWLADNFNHWRLNTLRLPSGIVARGLWLMNRWDYEEVRTAVSSLLDESAGETWLDVATALGRFLPWEYEYLRDRERPVGPEAARPPKPPATN